MAAPTRKRRPAAATGVDDPQLVNLANHLMRRGERLAGSQAHDPQLDRAAPGNRRQSEFSRRAQAALRSVYCRAEIAAAPRVSQATVSAIVSALLERGLVERIADDTDKRRRRLATTAAASA